MSAYAVLHKFQKPKKQIKTLTLQRQNARENWGFSLTGGWDQGQWIGKEMPLTVKTWKHFFSILFLEVSQVHPNSPAFHAGLEKGDFLVTFEDDLVLFMSWQDVEAKMKALQSQHLHLKIERGDVKPMVNPDEEEFLRRQTQTNRKKLNEDVVTIVLDKDRGIYRKYQ